MNIPPQSTLRIVRQLTDPFDTDTNYVQAIIRNSATGDIAGTVNLTDSGGQRFVGQFFTPPDGSGNGYYLDVTTTVYTDSGYTTKNTNYAIEAHTYFVYLVPVHLGGGGGSDVNYEKIRKIVKELLDEQEKMELPEVRDLTPELLASERRIKDSVSNAVSSIRIPEQVRPDLEGAVSRISSTVDDAVNTLLIAIDQKAVTPETDLMPIRQDISTTVAQVLAGINVLKTSIDRALAMNADTQQELSETRTATDEFVQKLPKRSERLQDMSTLRARKLLGI